MPATWDANNKSSGYALSGGNLVATSSALATVSATRTMTGKTYFEVTVSTLTGTISVGLVNRSYNMASGTILGTDNNGLGFKSTGAVVLNNVTLSTIQTYVQGDVVCAAVDIQNRLIWFRTNGGNWNNSGTANPATGAGGIDYSSMNLAALLPAGSCSATGAVLTANFSGAFAQTPPTGFITVDTCACLAYNAETTISAITTLLNPATSNPVTTTRTCGMFFGGYAGAPYAISGTVKESGAPVAKRVMAFQTATGLLLGATTSDAGTGAFSINCGNQTDVFAVAFDPTTFQALIYDRLTPV